MKIWKLHTVQHKVLSTIGLQVEIEDGASCPALHICFFKSSIWTQSNTVIKFFQHTLSSCNFQHDCFIVFLSCLNSFRYKIGISSGSLHDISWLKQKHSGLFRSNTFTERVQILNNVFVCICTEPSVLLLADFMFVNYGVFGKSLVSSNDCFDGNCWKHFIVSC